MRQSAEISVIHGRNIQWYLETDSLMVATEHGCGVEIFYKGHRGRYAFRHGSDWHIQIREDTFDDVSEEEVRNCQMLLFDLFPESKESFWETLRVRFSQST